MGVPPEGFSYRITSDGDVHVSHHGRVVTRLRGKSAEKVRRQLEQAAGAENEELRIQHVLARITGQYKHGNERERKTKRG